MPAQFGQLKIGQGEKGLFQSHLWCPNDLVRLWNRIEYNRQLLIKRYLKNEPGIQNFFWLIFSLQILWHLKQTLCSGGMVLRLSLKI